MKNRTTSRSHLATRRRAWPIVSGFFLLLLLLVFIPLPRQAVAQAREWRTTENMTHVQSGLTSNEISEFFDQIIPRQLEDRRIPGAALVVAQDGEIVFAKGYGFADLEQQKLVDPDETLFRTGSVAKLFTWAAVMQLVEKGKLDLHVDINQYLNGFQIPDTYPEPITLHALMTHTAGFEDGPMGMMRRRPEDLEPLGTFLAKRIPARIFPPGQVTAYSNYGTALASHVVELVSGLPFEQYVQQNILTPLGMEKSTFYQPVPSALAANLATGYVYREGTFQPQPFEIMQISPAGGASATASDMAHFIMAHLDGGKYGEARIMEEDTVRLMHQIHFRNDPQLTGIAYGFYELRINDRLLLTHGGDTVLFHSQLYLLPEEKLGLYVVYNAPGGVFARQELVQAFFDRFYPADSEEHFQLSIDVSQHTQKLTGKYISSRRSETTIEKVRLLYEPLYQPITVKLTTDGYLESDHPSIRSQNPNSYKPNLWHETEPDHYTRADGKDKLVFREDLQGNQVLYLDSVALRGFHKLAWFEELLFQPFFPIGLLWVVLGVMVYALFDKQALSVVRWLAVGTGGVALAFVIGMVAFALWGFTSYLFGDMSPVWWVVFALPFLLIVLTIGLAIMTLMPWPQVSNLRHLPYALAVLSMTGLLLWANYWNLIGWRF